MNFSTTAIIRRIINNKEVTIFDLTELLVYFDDTNNDYIGEGPLVNCPSVYDDYMYKKIKEMKKNNNLHCEKIVYNILRDEKAVGKFKKFRDWYYRMHVIN